MNEITELAEWKEIETRGNVARRIITFEGNQILPPHEHNFAHGHAVFRGAIRCELFDGEKLVSSTDYNEGDFFEVPAGLGHRLTKLREDTIGWCLFAVRDEDGGVAYKVTDGHRKDRFWHERLGGGDNVSAT